MPTPGYTLLASALPAVQVPSGFYSTWTARNGSASPAGASEKVPIPGTYFIIAPIAENFYAADVAALYGGAYGGITDGLQIAAAGPVASGITVSQGHCILNGLCEYNSPSTAITSNIVDGTAHIWIWAVQSGPRGQAQAGNLIITPVATSTTPPAGAVCLLGSITTSGGNITAIDYSGRMTCPGGVLQRQTADVGPPTDTPPAGVVFETITTNGLWRWTGAAYVPVGFSNGAAWVDKTVVSLAPTGGGNVAINAAAGNVFRLNMTDASNYTISNPTNAPAWGAEEIVLTFLNSTAGALGTIGFDTNYKLAGAFTAPGAGKRRVYVFYWSTVDSLWIEKSRSPADVG